MLNQTKPGLWENTNNVLEQLREDLSRAERLDFGNFVAEIKQEIAWLEFYDADHSATTHNTKKQNLEANTEVNNFFDAAMWYTCEIFKEVTQHGETEKAARCLRYAHHFLYLVFMECN